VSFPTTPILDTFTGTDGTDLPAYSANWADIGLGAWEIQGNAATGTAGGINVQSWNHTYGPDSEVYGTISTKPPDGGFMSMGLRQGSGNGYAVEVDPLAGTDNVLLLRIDSGVSTGLATFSQELTAGDGLGASMVGSLLTAWHRSGASGAWTAVGSTTDTTYTAAGTLSITNFADTTVRLDNFGGGSIVHLLTLLGAGS
jgi:hypothetical protein